MLDSASWYWTPQTRQLKELGQAGRRAPCATHVLPSRDALRGRVDDLNVLTLSPDLLHALHITHLESARILQGTRASMSSPLCMLDGRSHALPGTVQIRPKANGARAKLCRLCTQH